GTYRGVREIQHSGSTAGYSTFLARYPDRSLSIAVLCNAAGAPATLHAHQIADRLITDFPQAQRLDTTRVDVASLSPYYGIYRNDRTHTVVEVNAASVDRMRALPDNEYWMTNGARWRVDRSPAGKPAGFVFVQSDGDTVHYSYVADRFWTPSPLQLREFEGAYRSDEVGSTIQVRVVGDSLTMSVRPGEVMKLRPTYTDAFTSDGTAVWFTRDRGRVVAMHFGESRLWDLVVPRLR